jgi:hypothetical protein
LPALADCGGIGGGGGILEVDCRGEVGVGEDLAFTFFCRPDWDRALDANNEIATMPITPAVKIHAKL